AASKRKPVSRRNDSESDEEYEDVPEEEEEEEDSDGEGDDVENGNDESDADAPEPVIPDDFDEEDTGMTAKAVNKALRDYIEQQWDSKKPRREDLPPFEFDGPAPGPQGTETTALEIFQKYVSLRRR
ncbi:hypothetical protein HDU98_005134, partial [Podochytrium sp. JEL0797]